MYQFVCLKWGDKYSAEYVNKLFRMIDKNTREKFVLYCLTDDATNINQNVKILPLNDEGLTGWWCKLIFFKRHFFDLEGDILFLDLDVVITDGLDSFFEYESSDFTIIRDIRTGGYNSSVFRLAIGSKSSVWENFSVDKKNIMNDIYGDQDWITSQIKDASLWPDGWVVSFKLQCQSRVKHSFGMVGNWLRKLGFLKIKGVAVLPDGAKIVQFHGKPDPEDVANGPYKLYKHAPWIEKYWES